MDYATDAFCPVLIGSGGGAKLQDCITAWQVRSCSIGSAKAGKVLLILLTLHCTSSFT